MSLPQRGEKLSFDKVTGHVLQRREFLHNAHPVVEVVLDRGDGTHTMFWCRQPINEAVTQFGPQIVRNPVFHSTYRVDTGAAVLRATVEAAKEAIVKAFDRYWMMPVKVELRLETDHK